MTHPKIKKANQLINEKNFPPEIRMKGILLWSQDYEGNLLEEPGGRGRGDVENHEKTGEQNWSISY